MPVDPWAIDSLTLSGLEVRNSDSAFAMATGTALGSRSGVRPGDPGLTVSLAGSTINVSAGVATVAWPSQGVYRVALPSSVSPGTVNAAHATLARIDLVYLRVWDNSVDASGLNKGDVVYLAGTASSTPVAPTPAGTQIYMPLATINVPFSGNGSPSVSTAVRPVTVSPGGIIPDAAVAGSYVGQYRDNGTGLQRYNGTTWDYATLSGLGSILFKRKTADTARATATATDDPHLTVSVAANAVYVVEGMLHWYTTDETNADMAIGLTSPSGASGNWLGFAQPVGGTFADGIIRTMSTVIANTRTYAADSDTNNPSGLMLRALLITTSAGTFAVNWARTGASGTVTLLTNSYITLTRVA